MEIMNNAKWYRRVISFLLDVFFVNFIKTLLIQIFVFSKKRLEIMNNFYIEFNDLFGHIDIRKVKDYHVRFVVNNPVFNYFLWALFIMCITGIMYDFFCTVFLNSSTLGQKIMSLKVVNSKDNNKPGALKLFIRSILVSLPIIIIFLLIIFQLLSFLNFHVYAPKRNFIVITMIKFTKLTDPYVIAVALIIFILFWYDIYYITDGLIMSDILSGTRVVNSKFQSFDITANENNKDFVYFGDKFLNSLEKINIYLFDKVKLSITYIKDKIGGKFKTLKKDETNHKK